MAQADKFRIVCVVAARPNMVKAAPVMAELRRFTDLDAVLVHTGQHYDYLLSQVFFEQLEIPAPDHDLGVGSGTHHFQAGEAMRRFGELIPALRPDCIVVFGDVNATMACALAAAKEGIPLAHVEAGLRSFDRSMPEEINRLVADAVADLHFVTEQSGITNLALEGIPRERAFFVGNVMIDSLLRALSLAQRSPRLADMRLRAGSYLLVTLHRPSNVDDPARLRRTFAELERLAERMPVVFPAHPRTRKQLVAEGIHGREWQPGEAVGESGLWMLEPVPYIDFLALMHGAALVLTDSGGVQEETSALGVPCLTYRKNTERPVTVELGTNRIIGDEAERLVPEVLAALAAPRRPRASIPLWDGAAAARIVRVLRAYLYQRYPSRVVPADVPSWSALAAARDGVWESGALSRSGGNSAD